MVGCCVLSHPAEAIKIRGPIALSILIFSSHISSPKRTSKRPLPSVPPGRVSSQTLPQPPTPSSVWLLRRAIEQRPFKAGAPPISYFFDGRHFGAPNKRTKCSARKPGSRMPPQAHGKPWRRDSGPWRMLPWRGRAKPLGGRVSSGYLVLCFFVWRAEILHTCLVQE